MYTCICVCVQLYVVMGIGWRRLIGCLKLQVIFGKRATNYRALLRKMTYEDKAFYDPTPPCSSGVFFSKENQLLSIIIYKGLNISDTGLSFVDIYK